jgi:hypothetical protein
MHVKCGVATCSSSDGKLTASKTRVSSISTPKDELMLINLMDGQHLTSKSKVCELHFAESDMIKGKTVKKNGLEFFIPHEHLRLTSAEPICGRGPTCVVDEYLLSEQSSGGQVI